MNITIQFNYDTKPLTDSFLSMSVNQDKAELTVKWEEDCEEIYDLNDIDTYGIC